MKRLNQLSLLFLLLLIPSISWAQLSREEIAKACDDGFNFILATDLGRNGYYDQKTVAHAMGELADEGDAEFVLALGDTFHYIGVESSSDPLWLTNFELVYSHPELQIPWYPVVGNHEYRGNVQALIDYSKVSRRWQMPARYYKLSYKTDETHTLDIFILDTPPLIEKYRTKKKYSDASEQSREAQLQWLEKVLRESTADRKIVVGHHPIFADTSKDESERSDMQRYVFPLLQNYSVDLYVCGHIHNHQHIVKPDVKTNFVVLSSGSKSRKVKAIDGTQFCSPETGFGFISYKSGQLTMYLLDKEGNELYHFTI